MVMEVVVYLELHNAICTVCAPAEFGNDHFSGLQVHVDKQEDGEIVFETVLLSRLPIGITNDGPVKSVADMKGRERNFEKLNLWKKNWK